MSEAFTAPRRGRPPGRSARQEEQRKLNRTAIIHAAARVFAVKPYIHATIDDIIAAAEISRATFYFHFESKQALAIEIYESISDDWLAYFDKLLDIDTNSIQKLKQWTLGLAQLYVDHGYVTPLVEQLTLFEQWFRERLSQDRDALIDHLATAGLAGFLQARGRSKAALLQRARLQLLLRRLDQVCGLIARAENISAKDADIYAEAIAEEIKERAN